MGLSRLDNFLKSVKGNILYVDPNSLDSTDSIENQGNSPTRPFKTIQRALIESARFSYQVGNNNDRFDKTTIFLQPGDHIVDNRPGLIVDDNGIYRFRSGQIGDSDFVEWTSITNFNIADSENILYRLNSVDGGVIIPRGTSIVGVDLRKTKIIPKYVPNPENDNIGRSSIFRVTGGCFIYGFTILDASPNGTCYKDFTNTQFVPNFSHHKLTVFEYANGVDNVEINDTFISNLETSRTDLDMYYEKVALVYGDNSRDVVDPDYTDPENIVVDIQPVIDEYRIVGSKGFSVNITGVSVSGTLVTLTLDESSTELSANSPIKVSGITVGGLTSNNTYNGQFVINSVISDNQITYRTPTENQISEIDFSQGKLEFTIDTVTSASPYVFNCSVRSVYGMCGLHADGSKASGFKSMVAAQYTGISLQKDKNAFVRYNASAGTYTDGTSDSNINTNSRARFKPEYENYHIKVSNDAFIQLVSVFAIGYANHFLAESGGDFSVTNSNSNFGAKSLVSKGFRNESFEKDDVGYITHVNVPKYIDEEESNVEYLSLDVGLTTSVASQTRLYLQDETSFENPPVSILNGYRIGSKIDDKLYVQVAVNGITSSYQSSIVIPGTETSYVNELEVQRINNQNSIIQSTGTITLTDTHTFTTGEKVVVRSENGILPINLESNQLYYVITSNASPGLASTQVKLAESFNNSIIGDSIKPNNKGGVLTISSRVSDKKSGDVGHPVQWDAGNSNWYINVSSTDNNIYTLMTEQGEAGIGNGTPRTFIKRFQNTRNVSDSVYKLRYVIPKEVSLTRPPRDGFIIQETNNTSFASDSENDYYYPLDSQTSNTAGFIRNPGIIIDADWDTNVATIYTELPHKLSVNSEVKIENVVSAANTEGLYNKGFNGIFNVTEIDSKKSFSYELNSDPGDFYGNNTLERDINLPRYSQVKLPEIYQIYSSDEISSHIFGKQDGVYHLYVVNCSNSPTASPFQNENFSQPLTNLYPQIDRDNINSDPDASVCSASNDIIGEVFINDQERSITRETLIKSLNSLDIGIGVSSIVSSTGTAHTIHTKLNHGLSGITSVSIVLGKEGSDYVNGDYYGVNLVGFAGSITGSEANAHIQISGGELTSIKIMDPGGNYGIGNTLQISIPAGIGTISGFTTAVVQVENVTDNIGDIIDISNVSSSYSEYNTLYRVVGLSTLGDNLIDVESATTISTPSTTLIPSDNFANSLASYTGKLLTVSSISYNNETGIGNITFSSAHGLGVDDKVLFSGVSDSFFNKYANVLAVLSLTQASFWFEKNDDPLTPTGGLGYISGYSYRNGEWDSDTENTTGRNVYSYGGIQSTLNSALTSSPTESDELEIDNAVENGFRIGDYLLVNKEIFRIKSTVESNIVNVFRSLLGSPRQTHNSGAVVKKINLLPVELRRNSIIRASAHTFEYLGFGPGNYSTGFPEKQDRILSAKEELLSQSTKQSGGVVNYTAMNSDGDFYTGNKKINSATGSEEVFDTPLITYTGDTIKLKKGDVGVDIITPLEAVIERSIRVGGGELNDLTSQFDGPVIFNGKVTCNSEEGLEVDSLFIQGETEVSRQITVGIATPTSSGNYGDVKIKAEPNDIGKVGWVYTLENRWESFGKIGEGDKYLNPTVISNTLTCDYNLGVVTKTANTDITTINITNIPGNEETIYPYKIIINPSNTLSTPLESIDIQTNGDSITNDILWKGQNSPVGTAVSYYTIDFNIEKINVGVGWSVTAEFSTYI
jgi:hypothetical protein